MQVIAQCGHTTDVPNTPAAIEKAYNGFTPKHCRNCYVAMNPRWAFDRG